MVDRSEADSKSVGGWAGEGEGGHEKDMRRMNEDMILKIYNPSSPKLIKITSSLL